LDGFDNWIYTNLVEKKGGYMNKKLEHAHLMHFKDIFPDFPDGDVSHDDKPDFIVHYKDSPNTIGIEHTQIFKPDDSNKPIGNIWKYHDEIGKKIAQRARCLYLENHNLPLIVTISPFPDIEIKESDIEKIAKKVVNVISSTNIKLSETICLQPTVSNSDIFPKEIGRLYISTPKNQKEGLWKWSGSGWSIELTPKLIQDEIDKKEDKLVIYKLKCETAWLLLVVDDSRNPSFLDISHSSLEHIYETKFDRVFIFWNATLRFVELQLLH
jgi:hypothetical protein